MHRRFVILLACFAVLLVTASPVAANNKPTTGDKIDLLAPPATFPAGAPFFIEHGTGCDVIVYGDLPAYCMYAGTYFDLYLDGVLQKSSVDVDNARPYYVKHYLTNYPDGLAPGSHEFCGDFYFLGDQYFHTCATIEFQ
jgi:hypothetical protein